MKVDKNYNHFERNFTFKILYTAEETAADMIELLNFLKLDTVILVGHSMGERVAGHLSALYPECGKALWIF